MTDLTISITLLAVIFAMVAFFYASVGLGGGSSYTALLAIFGATTVTIPMVSLTLNVLVTTVGSIIFLSQRHARLRLIAPFLITSIPMAYVGGMLHLPKILFYLVLLVSLCVKIKYTSSNARLPWLLVVARLTFSVPVQQVKVKDVHGTQYGMRVLLTQWLLKQALS